MLLAEVISMVCPLTALGTDDAALQILFFVITLFCYHNVFDLIVMY